MDVTHTLVIPRLLPESILSFCELHYVTKVNSPIRFFDRRSDLFNFVTPSRVV